MDPVVQAHSRLWAFALALLAFLHACSPWGQAHYRALRRDLRARQFDRALARIEAARRPVYGQRSELLYWLDRGVLAAASDRFADSIASFETAKQVLMGGFTQHVSAHAAAAVLGERKLPYRAEPFERVAMHLLEADAYLALNNRDEAAVELRQMQTTLTRCQDEANRLHSTYADDAAGRWLAGLLREADGRELGHLSEARIDLEQAARLYREVESHHFATPMPEALRGDLARVQGLLGTADKASTGPASPLAIATSAPSVRLVVLIYDGLAPHKVEANWTVFLPLQVVTVPYPVFVADGRPAEGVRVVDRLSGQSAIAELASNFVAKAKVDLAERMDGIRERAMRRAVAKALGSEALIVGGAVHGGSSGAVAELIGLGLGIAGQATEQADLRSWQTLPARLSVAELVLPPGPFDLAIEAVGADAWAQPPLGQRTGEGRPGETIFWSTRLF